MRISSLLFYIGCVVIIFIGGNIYYDRIYRPCSTPLPYEIGFVDPRQNVTTADLTNLLKQAEAVWEKPAGRELFTFQSADNFFDKLTGRFVTINVRYDERQITKNILSDGERKLDAQAKNLALEKDSLEALQQQYAIDSAAYERAVAEWNKGKRSSQQTFSQLNAQKIALEQLAKRIDDRVASYNANVGAFNTSVNAFNASSNIENEAGTTSGRRVIDLYVLDGDETDVYLIAHELGHALGIDGHTSDENALMYYRLPKNITGVNKSDMALLSKACKW
jgi:hypothetical protein